MYVIYIDGEFHSTTYDARDVVFNLELNGLAVESVEYGHNRKIYITTLDEAA